jgi:RNA polymerase sigma-70 factor (ECF subfamily)
MKLSDFKKEGSLEGWIRRIMVNTALDQIRKEVKFRGDLDIEDVGYKLENNAFIEEEMMAEDLMKLVRAMPDGYRIVFNMFAIEGYSHAEIAATLGVTENTSKSQYSRARAYLRERLEKK